jgi:hypothetical protein
MEKSNYEKSKSSILKWRENNKEKFTEYMHDYYKNVYYVKNKEQINKKRCELYHFTKECKRLRAILL